MSRSAPLCVALARNGRESRGCRKRRGDLRISEQKLETRLDLRLRIVESALLTLRTAGSRGWGRRRGARNTWARTPFLQSSTNAREKWLSSTRHAPGRRGVVLDRAGCHAAE